MKISTLVSTAVLSASGALSSPTAALKPTKILRVKRDTPLEPRIPGYAVVDPKWHFNTPNHGLVEAHGTVQEALRLVHELDPDYNPFPSSSPSSPPNANTERQDFDFPTPKDNEVATLAQPAWARASPSNDPNDDFFIPTPQSLNYTRPVTLNVTCFPPDMKPGNLAMVLDNLDYLWDMAFTWPRPVNEGHSCGRVACEWWVSTWWCNHNDNPLELTAWADIMYAMEDILGECRDRSRWSYGISPAEEIAGIAWMKGNYSVRVGGETEWC